jgi:hypothetical protein
LASSKLEKSLIVSSIIDTIREGGGSFVRQDTRSKTWVEVGDRLAREKAGQAIRASLRKKPSSPKTLLLSPTSPKPGFLSKNELNQSATSSSKKLNMLKQNAITDFNCPSRNPFAQEVRDIRFKQKEMSEARISVAHLDKGDWLDAPATQFPSVAPPAQQSDWLGQYNAQVAPPAPPAYAKQHAWTGQDNLSNLNPLPLHDNVGYAGGRGNDPDSDPLMLMALSLRRFSSTAMSTISCLDGQDCDHGEFCSNPGAHQHALYQHPSHEPSSHQHPSHEPSSQEVNEEEGRNRINLGDPNTRDLLL